MRGLLLMVLFLICLLGIEAKRKKLKNGPKVPKAKINRTQVEDDEFSNWKLKSKRKYKTKEQEDAAADNYIRAKRKVADFNSQKNVSFQMNVPDFADQDPEDFLDSVAGLSPPEEIEEQMTKGSTFQAGEVSWTTKQMVNKIDSGSTNNKKPTKKNQNRKKGKKTTKAKRSRREVGSKTTSKTGKFNSTLNSESGNNSSSSIKPKNMTKSTSKSSSQLKSSSKPAVKNFNLSTLKPRNSSASKHKVGRGIVTTSTTVEATTTENPTRSTSTTRRTTTRKTTSKRPTKKTQKNGKKVGVTTTNPRRTSTNKAQIATTSNVRTTAKVIEGSSSISLRTSSTEAINTGRTENDSTSAYFYPTLVNASTNPDSSITNRVTSKETPLPETSTLSQETPKSTLSPFTSSIPETTLSLTSREDTTRSETAIESSTKKPNTGERIDPAGQNSDIPTKLPPWTTTLNSSSSESLTTVESTIPATLSPSTEVASTSRFPLWTTASTSSTEEPTTRSSTTSSSTSTSTTTPETTSTSSSTSTTSSTTTTSTSTTMPPTTTSTTSSTSSTTSTLPSTTSTTSTRPSTTSTRPLTTSTTSTRPLTTRTTTSRPPPTTTASSLIPTRVNYTHTMPEIKDQLDCGSCYIFSALAVVEYDSYLKQQRSQYLADQDYLDCSGAQGNCDGGWPANVLSYVRNSGIADGLRYTYNGIQSSCKRNQFPPIKNITNHCFKYFGGDENALRDLVATKGVVAVGVTLTVDMMYYKSGVFYDPTCTTNTDHAVAIVGYGTDNASGKDYWIVRNSWGKNWGMNGYGWFARNQQNNCGIANFAFHLC